MKFKTSLKPDTNIIDLTPLVDVIFLLLIFFIVTSDILPLKSLNIEHPKIERATAPRTSQILVVMDAQNVIYVGSKKEIVDFYSFKESLRNEIENCMAFQSGVDPTVVLSIDRRVEYGAFLRLFSLAQEANVKLRLVYSDDRAG